MLVKISASELFLNHFYFLAILSFMIFIKRIKKKCLHTAFKIGREFS